MKNTLIITLICFSAFTLGQVPEFPKFKKIDAIDVTIDLNNILEEWNFRFKNLNELPDRLSLGSEFSGKIKADLNPIGQKEGRDLDLLCEFKDGKPNGLQYYIEKHSVEISRYRDGTLDLQETYRKAANGIFYLAVAKRFENEKLVWEFNQYNYGETDEFSRSQCWQNDLRNGQTIEIYKNDGVQYLWNFKENYYSGVQQVFDLDSVLLSEVSLIMGNGTLEVERKHDNQRIEFIDGRKHYEKLIYKNGQLKYEEKENGVKEWYENGQLKYEEKENGVKEWYENGQLKYEENENGVKEWDENGQLKYEEIYGNKQHNDVYREWYENGQLKYEENENGVKEWYKNGRLKHEVLYENE